jgi:hypothetical protein
VTLTLTGGTRRRVRAGINRWAWAAAVASATLVVGLRLVIVDIAEPAGVTAVPVELPSSPAIESAYGVRFVQLDVLAGGGLVELRYLVVDPARSARLHEAGQAHLPRIVTQSGAQLTETPYHSHARTETAGASYSILYRNDGGAVERGDAVTLRVGDLPLDDVIAR